MLLRVHVYYVHVCMYDFGITTHVLIKNVLHLSKLHNRLTVVPPVLK